MENEIVKQDNSVDILISEGLKNNANIEVMERLFALAKESNAIRAKREFFFALSKFQKEIPTIAKNKAVKSKDGVVKYHYAPLEEIVEQVKAGLEENGFSYTLKTKQENNRMTVFCEAHHVGGHTEVTDITVPIGSDYMSAQQQVGAALTFAKRYAFCDAFGLMTGDEDTDAVETEELTKTEKQEAKKEEPKKDTGKVEFKDKPVEFRLNWAKNKAKELDIKIIMTDLETLSKEEQYQTLLKAIKAVNNKKEEPKKEEPKKETASEDAPF